MVVVCPSIEIREQICGHEFTVEWLLKSLEENDDNFRENHGSKVIRKLEAKDISGGKGMFSIVLKVDLHLEEDGQTTVYTTILKIPGTNSWEKVAEEGADVEEMKFVSFS
uniref:Bet v I/Major latex protein domain-containing protein n=1 Tax=Panagrolaimus sp. JU765 TaxID=591449 RepID=A0AC34R3C6_9BILA